MPNSASAHFDTERLMLRVLGGKGAKDRYTLLPRYLLSEFRAYLAQLQPALAISGAQFQHPFARQHGA